MLFRPDITVVIATFNSDKLLGRVLDAVKRQDYPQQSLEILVVDGGSLDTTCALAVSYGCVVISNPETEPINAKFLGLKHANGRYLVYLDHDEVMLDSSSLRRKYEVFHRERDVHAVVGSGYINPDSKNIVNEYINEFGDPFSFFIYRLSKGSKFFIETMKKRYSVSKETESYLIIDFARMKHLPIMELVALGSMIDKDYFCVTFPEILFDKKRIGQLFYHLIEKAPRVAITKNDAIVHYSSEKILLFLAKIRWRIKNNIYFVKETGAAGFSGREQFGSTLANFKKYLFPFYAFLLIFPIIDSCYLVLTRRNFRYFLHIPLILYTAGYIVYHSFLNGIGYRPVQRSYDEAKKIKIKNQK
jgi:glycosyltransferase involved in cell wall biosynthesis